MVSWETHQTIATAFSFIAFALVSIPLYWHLEAWNVGCVMYIFWTGSQCLIQFINMTVWKDNVINWVPVWCDITSRWRLASGIGICTASLIINRRLYKIASVSAVSITHADKRRMIWIDLAIGLVPSAVCVGLYWFYQGHRFDLFEGYGCMYEFPNTILSYFLYTIWPVVIGLISMVYCSLTLYAFYKRRRQFKELMSSNSNLTYNRYLRLMGLAGIEMVCTVPLGVWNVVNSAVQPIYKWEGLANVHYDFSRVDQYPTIVWYNVPAVRRAIQFTIWDPIACALLFFLFFGCAEEARKHYSTALTSVVKRVGISTSFLTRTGSASNASMGGSKLPSGGLARVTIPSFVQRKTRNASVTSFSDRLSISVSFDDDTPIDESKIAYSPSQSSVSSTYMGSPVKALDAEKEAGEPASPVSTNNAEVAQEIVAISRPTPDVPAPVSHDVSDMV
ncbi:putative fungal pheromoneG-protein-coupled receptor [Laetiporus sulphureus 93-53]|uniref:Putative fungal pheromoneG-protein-coupled receptor n=1 Tax=Laetiporus sulphureus 93-53 TaxID=1314785 RepID=A0A165B4Y6_9APHY|nr:putative fungal pheromoneG-protein-coupled receptor [Laetiporus sulphureus 93-53]KZT00247.1 putative fungal pheromoneG-protein-coupled receptor [Laetiporus sulphureus 93-53]